MTAATAAETFDPAAITGLPEPARRWLGHAIAPGTPLWSSVEGAPFRRYPFGEFFRAEITGAVFS